MSDANPPMELIPADKTHQTITDDTGEVITHYFAAKEIQAINAAIAINRPLLLWGEPGIGKSQLAKAAAQALGRVFIPFVADAQTEAHDLLWRFDAVARLAEAQIQSAAQHDRSALAMKHFLIPGPLWWAFNWESALNVITPDRPASELNESMCQRQPPAIASGCAVQKGVVVLIDEIDKADSSVPNGLLEALGANRFQPQGWGEVVNCQGIKPLVLITTNEERRLPDAFQRRCLSLHLAFPATNDNDAQVQFLLQRARANFKTLDQERYSELEDKTVLEAAAALLVADRAYAKEKSLYPLPGLAEYFDLLRGVQRLSQATQQSPVDLMGQLQQFTYQKHPHFHRQ
ncbi:MAG: AAA family ATPase [Thiofilum sp.]|uniref:AAA family ATPase n=1 Tax=Thiofilum sp. TaxID=2212733 RepID=UPI0025F2766B|nr:AAA family ATPase [Thiofilum sp.]MBK8454427.1 AAA family ATPase [Thiofilum sp.]